MTVGIMPESNRKGRAVCQFWLQGGKHNVTPTDKNPSDESHPEVEGSEGTTTGPSSGLHDRMKIYLVGKL